MGKFIEEFYYGNLDPQARSTKENKAVQKQMEILMLIWPIPVLAGSGMLLIAVGIVLLQKKRKTNA